MNTWLGGYATASANERSEPASAGSSRSVCSRLGFDPCATRPGAWASTQAAPRIEGKATRATLLVCPAEATPDLGHALPDRLDVQDELHQLHLVAVQRGVNRGLNHGLGHVIHGESQRDSSQWPGPGRVAA